MNPSFSRWPYQDTQRSIRIQSHSKNYITVLFTSPNHNMISSFGGEDSCTICREFVVEIWIVYCLNLGLLYLTPTIYIYIHILWLQHARSPAIIHGSKHGLDSITMITDQSLSQPISIYLVAATRLKNVTQMGSFRQLRAKVQKMETATP